MDQHETREYRRWSWFYNRLNLLKSLEFSYHRSDHDPLPRTDEQKEAFDYYFLEESKRESRGWKSISLNEYSKLEWRAIKRWVRQKGADRAFLSIQTPIMEVWAIIGEATTNCSGVTLHPQVYDEFFWEFLQSLPKRPCSAVFEGCTEVPEEVRRILRRKNVFTVKGRYGVAISFEIISDSAYERIVEIAKEVSVREEAPPLARYWSTGTSSTVLWTTLVSV